MLAGSRSRRSAGGETAHWPRTPRHRRSPLELAHQRRRLNVGVEEGDDQVGDRPGLGIALPDIADQLDRIKVVEYEHNGARIRQTSELDRDLTALLAKLGVPLPPKLHAVAAVAARSAV